MGVWVGECVRMCVLEHQATLVRRQASSNKQHLESPSARRSFETLPEAPRDRESPRETCSRPGRPRCLSESRARKVARPGWQERGGKGCVFARVSARALVCVCVCARACMRWGVSEVVRVLSDAKLCWVAMVSKALGRASAATSWTAAILDADFKSQPAGRGCRVHQHPAL